MPSLLPLAAWVGGGAPAAQAQSLGLASGEVLRGRFTQQRFLQGFNAPLTSTGSFILAPGRGVVWRGEAPFALVTVMGPGGLVQRVAGGATTHYPASRLPAIVRLYEIFGAALSGDWRKLEAVFEVRREGTESDWKVTLTPLRSGDGGLPLRQVAGAGRPLRRFGGGHARQRRLGPHRVQPAGAVAGSDRRRNQRASRHGRPSMRRVAGGGLAGDRRRRLRLPDGVGHGRLSDTNRPAGAAAARGARPGGGTGQPGRVAQPWSAHPAGFRRHRSRARPHGRPAGDGRHRRHRPGRSARRRGSAGCRPAARDILLSPSRRPAQRGRSRGPR